MTAESTVLHVGPERVACQGAGFQTCLVVAHDPIEDWQILYTPIEGFSFEPGFECVLRVRTEPVDNSPADASNRRLILEGIEDRRPAVPLAMTAWSMKAIEEAGGPLPVITGSEVTAVFDPEREMVTGSAGCNRYFAQYRATPPKLEISAAGSTRMFCGEPEGVMEQEDAYLAVLGEADRFRIWDGVLRIRARNDRALVYEASDYRPS